MSRFPSEKALEAKRQAYYANVHKEGQIHGPQDQIQALMGREIRKRFAYSADTARQILPVCYDAIQAVTTLKTCNDSLRSSSGFFVVPLLNASAQGNSHWPDYECMLKMVAHILAKSEKIKPVLNKSNLNFLNTIQAACGTLLHTIPELYDLDVRHVEANEQGTFNAFLPPEAHGISSEPWPCTFDQALQTLHAIKNRALRAVRALEQLNASSTPSSGTQSQISFPQHAHTEVTSKLLSACNKSIALIHHLIDLDHLIYYKYQPSRPSLQPMRKLGPKHLPDYNCISDMARHVLELSHDGSYAFIHLCDDTCNFDDEICNSVHQLIEYMELFDQTEKQLNQTFLPDKARNIDEPFPATFEEALCTMEHVSKTLTQSIQTPRDPDPRKDPRNVRRAWGAPLLYA